MTTGSPLYSTPPPPPPLLGALSPPLLLAPPLLPAASPPLLLTVERSSSLLLPPPATSAAWPLLPPLLLVLASLPLADAAAASPPPLALASAGAVRLAPAWARAGWRRSRRQPEAPTALADRGRRAGGTPACQPLPPGRPPHLHQLERRLAVELFEVLLQIPHARLAAVRLNQAAQGLVGDRNRAVGHAGVGAGLGLQVGSRDRGLLVCGERGGGLGVGGRRVVRGVRGCRAFKQRPPARQHSAGTALPAQARHTAAPRATARPPTRRVAAEADDLHSVKQRARDGVQHVGGAHEEDLLGGRRGGPEGARRGRATMRGVAETAGQAPGWLEGGKRAASDRAHALPRSHEHTDADLGQVDGHVEVVVQEGAVLLGVQQLQQRAGRRGGGFGRTRVGGAGLGVGLMRRGLVGWRRHRPQRALPLAKGARPAGPAPPANLAGSPVWPRPSLSISSISTSGLTAPVDLRHCTILPGMAPT
jgi:hypothetical protein